MSSPAVPSLAEPAPGSAPTSMHREASVFLVWGAGIIMLAHGMELLHSGRPNWLALAIRIAWAALLLLQAVLLRRAGRTVLLAGTATALFGSAILDLALLAVTGRSASPLVWFTPVLATVLPFMAFEMIWVGLAGSAVLMTGTWLILLADGVPIGEHIAWANASGGALACGWLLARAHERARRAQEARRLELAEAMASIKTLTGLLPVCAWCHRVRTDQGYWEQIEAYVAQHTGATFTHGLCQDCFHENFEDADGDENDQSGR